MSKTKYIFGLDVFFSGQKYFWTLFSALSTGLKSLTPCLLPNSSVPYLSFKTQVKISFSVGTIVNVL